MKKVNLPVGNILTMEIDSNDIGNGIIVYEEGKAYQKLASIEVGPAINELEQARMNAGQVICATVNIENELEKLIADYLFGSVQNDKVAKRKYFFSNELLRTSHFSYSSKKSLANKIILKMQLLSGSDNNDLQKRLKNIMEYRNAFAHGVLRVDQKKGCSLEYYSGETKKHILNDQFWSELEKDYEIAGKLLKKALDKLNEIQI